MTYAQIGEWVKENFNLNEYYNLEDLIDDVKRTFDVQQSFFPNESIKYIKDEWVEALTGIPETSLDYGGPQRETLQDVQADYRQRFSNFFEEENPVPQYHDVEQTLATPPPVIENLPNIEEEQNRGWLAGGFKDFARRIWSRLRG